ncbi:MAG: S26 family signal peptidase [Flavobacteriales bacterium]
MYLPEIFLLLLVAVYCVTLHRLLSRAYKPTFLSYIPVVQFIPFLQVIKRPWWWIILLLIPGVNLVMLMIINVELGISFNKRTTAEQWKFALLPWYALPQLAFLDQNAIYVGPRDWKNKKKSFTREWGEAIVFAIVAATVIRTFFLEAFTIPTPSMEKSMLVGDYLFVSKMAYGPKIPQTPVSVPFVHNTLPGSMRNSYVEWFNLPYFRLPGLGRVERFDPVVFNFPHGDTILVDAYYAGHDYYQILRTEALYLAGNRFDEYKANRTRYEAMARRNFGQKKVCESCKAGRQTRKGYPIGGVKDRPVDKKENYIKRCIGLPGESLQIINRQVYINGKPIENPEGLMFSYYFGVSSANVLGKVEEEMDIPGRMLEPVGQDSLGRYVYRASFTDYEFRKLSKNKDIRFIEVSNDSLAGENMMEIFPNSPMAPFNTWTRDNLGPLRIPAAGESIDLTPANIAMYKRVITVYEGATWEERDGGIVINGVPASSYTFKYNYYWMMGDNRHQSADSRYWGFVPETHIVGKAVFTWFSKEKEEYHGSSRIRWSRIFRMVE